jgi:hypothetical protein
MSWHFSQALVEEYLEANSLDGEQSAPWNTNPMPRLFSHSDKMMEFCNRSPFGMTCEPLTESHGEELLTWFLAGFPVKISALPEKEPELMGSAADYGKKCGGLLAKYDPVSRSWKTAQRLLFGGLEEFSATWPRWGTMQNGECLVLRTLAHNTKGNASGSWPTPTKWEEKYPFSPSPGDHYHGIGWRLWNIHNLQPTPNVYEAMMVWPIGWTELQGVETVKYQQWLNLHGNY